MLEAPEQDYAPEMTAPRRTAATPNRKLRRDLSDDFAEDFADDFADEDAPVARRRRGGVRLKFRGGLPRTKWGRIAAGFVVLVFLGLCTAAALMARDSLLHDERFVIQSSSSIEFVGNVHATREQLLNVFGGDLERNIFNVSLEQRRLDLERMPWVEHATVMRLLPNRLRVSVVERTPVAFVRDGSHIGLVDANGVLLDMPPGAKGDAHYSFPVVTGISASDPLSTRAARMKLFERFTGDLDGAGDKISQGLSEVDLSNPEDVKALIPSDSADVLVHFGEDDFLNRYKKFEEHLPEWRMQYPRLSSVDMRYERQVVLEMQPGTAASTAASPASGSTAAAGSAASAVPASGTAPPQAAAVKSASPARPAARSAHRAAVKTKTSVAQKAVAKGHPAAKHVAAKGKPAARGPAPVRAVSEVAFSVPAKTGGAKVATRPAARGRAVERSSAAKHHSSQAVHP